MTHQPETTPTTPDILVGTSSFGQDERGFPVYDAYWEAGGRGFDTAWIYGHAYGPGCCESVVGRWAAARGVTDDAWVLAKGAHTPECHPDRIERQLDESLDRMQRPAVSLYMMHRDNRGVPVGEFVDVMVTLVHKGRTPAYGFSNWTLDRVWEAVAYADSRGLPRPAGVSNQFSLITMVRPIHPGTQGANDRSWRAWLADANVRLYPWASQGRGAHALTDPEQLRTDALAECWFSEPNVARLRRARELAHRKGISSTGIALAWVLAQPFPVCPIIGPRSVAEVRDSLRSLADSPRLLTPEERDWLEDGGAPPGP